MYIYLYIICLHTYLHTEIRNPPGGLAAPGAPQGAARLRSLYVDTYVCIYIYVYKLLKKYYDYYYYYFLLYTSYASDE